MYDIYNLTRGVMSFYDVSIYVQEAQITWRFITTNISKHDYSNE